MPRSLSANESSETKAPLRRYEEETRVRPHPPWIRYGAAVAMTVGVTLIARELDPFWDVSGRHPYLIEWPTVIAAAWLGGKNA